MLERMKWDEVYSLWNYESHTSPKILSEPITAVSVFIDYRQKGYIYGFDWLKNENAYLRKELIEKSPNQFRDMECSNKGTIQTAEMLIDAKNEEELAAIWIAATAKELYERRNEYKKSVGRYANILHMAACDFLRSRFYLWHHAMKSLVPNILISPSIIENIDCSDAAPVMGLIQTNTVLLKSSWSILRYSSLKDEDFPKARYRLNK